MDNQTNNTENNEIMETVEEQVPQTIEEAFPDEELDEETLNIIYNRPIKEFNENDFLPKIKNKKEKSSNKQADKKSMTINEFLNLNVEKKWVSQRTQNKKTDTVKSKRVFNPRLPPYRSLKNKNNKINNDLNINNLNLFPSLN
jgi:hypothetical protein